MQYSDIVGKYQLIGGIVRKGDKTKKSALIRKLSEEIPHLANCIANNKIKEEYHSERTDEEIFFSKKFGVYAQYKTYIYSVGFNNITKDIIKRVSKRPENRWVSLNEIKKGTASDGKAIFKLAPAAIDSIKELQPNIIVNQYDINTLLEKTWVKVLLAIAGLSGLVSLVIPLFI